MFKKAMSLSVCAMRKRAGNIKRIFKRDGLGEKHKGAGARYGVKKTGSCSTPSC